MEIEKNIFTFIIYTIIITVIGAIAVIAFTQAHKNISKVSDLQKSFAFVKSEWDKEKSVLDKTNSDVLEKLNEIRKNWDEVIKTGDNMTLRYDGTLENSNGKTMENNTYTLIGPRQCIPHQDGKNNPINCNMSFEKGITNVNGWSINKN